MPIKPRTVGDDIANSLLSVLPAKDKNVFDVAGSSTHMAWLGIISLWKKPFWTRTWVFQESTIPEKFLSRTLAGVVVLPHSTKVTFVCGAHQASWKAFGAAHIMSLNILATPDVDSKFLVGAAQSFAKLLSFREERILGAPWSFLDVLRSFRHTQCSDPRDKVYAPLCLAPQNAFNYIKPDYGNKTTLEVYTEVVRYSLTQSGHELDFLGYIQYPGEPEIVETPQGAKCTLPSWTPNFSNPLDLAPIPKLLQVPDDMDSRRPAFRDKRGIPTYKGQRVSAYRPLGDAPSRTFIDGNQLFVSGAYVDSVKDVIPNTGPDLEACKAFARQRSSQWAAEMNHKYFTGESYHDAINRTLVLDLIYDYLGRPSERGGKHDLVFSKKPRTELSLIEYRYQMNMRIALNKAQTSRNLGLSQNMYTLVVPKTTAVGDQIWALSGGQALYVMRLVNQEFKQYRIIGECYAHGLMDGEIARRLHVREATMEDICLI